MAVLVPSLEAFVIATVVIILISAIGFLVYSKSDNPVVGASGLVLGYYSFNILYGLLGIGNGGTFTAVFLLLLFGRRIWGILRNDGGGISQIAHVAGFIGGIFGAASLVRLGM